MNRPYMWKYLHSNQQGEVHNWNSWEDIRCTERKELESTQNICTGNELDQMLHNILLAWQCCPFLDLRSVLMLGTGFLTKKAHFWMLLLLWDGLVRRPFPDWSRSWFLYSCEIKSENGLGMRIGEDFYHVDHVPLCPSGNGGLVALLMLWYEMDFSCSWFLKHLFGMAKLASSPSPV